MCLCRDGAERKKRHYRRGCGDEMRDDDVGYCRIDSLYKYYIIHTHQRPPQGKIIYISNFRLDIFEVDYF